VAEGVWLGPLVADLDAFALVLEDEGARGLRPDDLLVDGAGLDEAMHLQALADVAGRVRVDLVDMLVVVGLGDRGADEETAADREHRDREQDLRLLAHLLVAGAAQPVLEEVRDAEGAGRHQQGEPPWVVADQEPVRKNDEESEKASNQHGLHPGRPAPGDGRATRLAQAGPSLLFRPGCETQARSQSSRRWRPCASWGLRPRRSGTGAPRAC